MLFQLCNMLKYELLLGEKLVILVEGGNQLLKVMLNGIIFNNDDYMEYFMLFFLVLLMYVIDFFVLILFFLVLFQNLISKIRFNFEFEVKFVIDNKLLLNKKDSLKIIDVFCWLRNLFSVYQYFY